MGILMIYLTTNTEIGTSPKSLLANTLRAVNGKSQLFNKDILCL